MRQKKRENSAILQSQKTRRKGSKSKSRAVMSKSNNKRSKAQKSYQPMSTLQMKSMPEKEKESSSMVDEFCKDLYDFLGESRAENQSKLSRIGQIGKGEMKGKMDSR